MKTVLLTGGLGQLGSFSYEQLKGKYNIVLIDNRSNAKINPPEDVLFIDRDIRDKIAYTNLPDIDYIVHAAAQISVEQSTRNPIFDAENNVLGTLQLLEFARKEDIEKFIYISSAATYGKPKFLPITEAHPRNPMSPYGLSKLVAEKYTLLYNELYGLDTCALILFNLYSRLQKKGDPYAGVIYKFISQIKSNHPPTIEGDGAQTRDFIHTQDVSRAIELTLDSNKTKGQTYNIGTGTPVSILEVAKTLIDISQKDLEPVHVKPRIGDIKDSYCSIEKAKRDLKFEPKINLNDGLIEVYNNIIL
ncbi:MAG: NAD-dependent epimerase/dehydratase family protein [Candidatus Heimdallarchaeaceae archaeon]